MLCEEEPYFLEMVRYIHLNPLRGKVVESMAGLKESRLTGHSVRMGTITRPWQETGEVLRRFSGRAGEARRKYEVFVGEGNKRSAPQELEGGGLVWSAGGWGAVMDLRKGREGYRSDERVLGGSGFVETLLREAEKEAAERKVVDRGWDLRRMVKAVCERVGIESSALAGGGRGRGVTQAREGISYLWVKRLGRSGGELSRETGMKPITVNYAAERGVERAEEWEDVLATR